jgi:riboflavin synthase
LFTGLVVEMGAVVSVTHKPSGASLTVKTGTIGKDAAVGDSIAVNGTCLTVVAMQGPLLSFDVSVETLESTNIGRLKPGDRVNLEPSLRPDGKLGGHFVTGHVDAVGKLGSKTRIGDALKIFIDAPSEVTDFLVEKGSVAIDGISLTVVDVSKDGFSVVIIPHTSQVTTMGFKGTGETVNIEADILGKYVARFLARSRSETTTGDDSLVKSLIKAGYI